MGFVEKIYTSVFGVLNGLAERQYMEVAAQIGLTGQLLATIAVIFMLINLSLQTIPMSQETVLITSIKLILIGSFLQNWSQFNSVATAVFDLFDGVSAALVNPVVSGTGDTLSGPRSFAQSFDDILARVADYANVTAGRLNIQGSVVNGIIWLLMGIFSAVVALLIVGSRIVLTLLIAMAPLAIICTMFSVTKGFFERWLNGVITYSLYPVVIAAVFSTILGLLWSVLDLIGNPEEVTSIGQVTPVLGVLCLSIILSGMVPMITSSLSGSIGLHDMVTTSLGRASARIAGSAGSKVYQQTKQASSTVANDTAAYMKNPAANTRGEVNLRADQLNRAAERVQRLRRK